MTTRDSSCRQCGAMFIKQRNPNQVYCPVTACQRERKNKWRREKMNVDCDYKNNQQMANARWQSKNPDYWRNYRASHPAYVQCNREAQRVRDSASGKNTSLVEHDMDADSNASHLAKSDGLHHEALIHAGSYWLIAMDGDLAKSDALPVKIAVITKGSNESHDLAKSLLYSLDG